MSAIAGIFNYNKDPISEEHSLILMNALQKFPADDAKIWQKQNAFLGCHAQWITPESIGEQLPFYDNERKLAITADAIIDNRKELFEKLQVSKERRKEIPDSQLILLAYCKWGEECPQYLVGDFSFMIWDEKQQKLFGARDYSGARTLYYFNDQKHLAFCTLIQPLLLLPYVEKELNESWLADFLAIPDMFDTIDPTSTVYKTINQVPPSHTISINQGIIKISRYCNLTVDEKIILNSDAEYEEAFKGIFDNTIKNYLRTDYKVGSRLSGGLDSGSVVGFAARILRNQNKQLNTYSYVPLNDFEDWTHKSKIANERPFIQSTIDYVGNIKPNFLDFPDRSPFSVIDEWLDILEMPYKFFENSHWISGIYKEASNQGVKVMLNGARGNYSISWGNALDYYSRLFRSFQWINLFKEINKFIYVKGTGKKRVAQVLLRKSLPSFNINKEFLMPVLINQDFAKRMNVFERLQEVGINETGSHIPDTFVARKNQFEKLYYRSNGAIDTKFSLRDSIWNRDPTNDLRVVRFCLSVPDSQYIQNGLDRALIRRSTKNVLPDKVRLNHLYKGIQGADGIQRMLPNWAEFIDQLQEMSKNQMISEYVNIDVIESAIAKIKDNPQPELILDLDFKVLMRSLILYRFLQKEF